MAFKTKSAYDPSLEKAVRKNEKEDLAPCRSAQPCSGPASKRRSAFVLSRPRFQVINLRLCSPRQGIFLPSFKPAANVFGIQSQSLANGLESENALVVLVLNPFRGFLEQGFAFDILGDRKSVV